MKWSKLKHKYKTEFLHESLRKRVDFHFDVYRKSHDQAGEVLRIAVDGETVFKGNSLRYELRENSLTSKFKREDPERTWRETYEMAEQVLASEFLHPRYWITEAMREVMILPIEEALRHDNPLIRAFALLDKRVGRRTLERLDVSDEQHPLIKMFFELRSAV